MSRLVAILGAMVAGLVAILGFKSAKYQKEKGKRAWDAVDSAKRRQANEKYVEDNVNDDAGDRFNELFNTESNKGDSD